MSNAIADDGTTYYNIEEIYWQSEDAEMAHMSLDDRSVPRTDGRGGTYSLWGRIEYYARQHEKN